MCVLIKLQTNDDHNCFFKPGAHWPQAGVRLVSRNHFCAAKVYVCVCVCACVCVCVSTPEPINN